MPSFSVIIPVLNELPAGVNRTVEQVYRVGAGLDIEVIVVDGDDGGKTINALGNDGIIKGIAARGRGKQMNKGAALAQGEILLFLHADTELPQHAFSLISSRMEDERYAGGFFDLGIDSDRSIFRLIERLVYVRTRLTRVPYGDQAIFIRRGCFDRLNGFREISIMEDVDFMKRVNGSGYKMCIIRRQVKTSPRRWEREGVFYCTLRNWALSGLYFLGVNPDDLVKFYYRDWDEPRGPR